MKPEVMTLLVCCSLVAAVNAEQYRLKLPVTVDILENGEVVGSKKLKAGTVLEIAHAENPSETNGVSSKASVKVATRLTPSKISPIMFKNTQPASAVFRAKIEMGDSYYGPFEGKDKMYWAIDVRAYNEGWENYETLYGYVPKTSKIAKRIVDVLKDGNEHSCHIKVKPVKNGDDKDYITIEDLEIVDTPK